MTRIISDTYIKKDKHIWGNDPNTDFNRKILAVNNMYGWLYEKGILEKASFVFKDYNDITYFALDAKSLLPYREQMEKAEIGGAALAVHHIFDEAYTPCIYSGVIELGWTMRTYRSHDDFVGSSWECGLIQSLNIEGIHKIAEIRDEQGVTAAVQALYDQFDWNLTIPEQKRYLEALDYFKSEVQTNIENEYVKNHGRELIYCYEHKKSLPDFDFWTRYEDLCNEKLTYDEYLAIDSGFDGDPYEIEPSNTGAVAKIKENLQNYRDSVKHAEKWIAVLSNQEKTETSLRSKDTALSLTDRIQAAASKTVTGNSVSDKKTITPER